MLALYFLRLGNRRAQSHGKVVGEMVAADGNGRRMTQHSVAEDDEFRRAAADIEQAAAEFALILREAGFGRSKRLENSVRDFNPRLVDGDHQILHRRSGGSHQMDVHFEALADHSQRVANIVVRVEEKFLREHVQHDAILGKRDVARGIHGMANVVAVDVSRAVAQRDSAAAVDAANVAAGHAGDGALDGHVRRHLRLLQSRAGWKSRSRRYWRSSPCAVPWIPPRPWPRISRPFHPLRR